MQAFHGCATSANDLGKRVHFWRADRNGSLVAFLKPELSPPERTLAQVEGWILGVPGLIREPVQILCNRT
jgi:hypothetical protein